MAEDLEIKRVLSLEERYEEEIKELENEIAIIDRQIDNKDRHREQLDISLEHRQKYHQKGGDEGVFEQKMAHEAEVIVKRAQ